MMIRLFPIPICCISPEVAASVITILTRLRGHLESDTMVHPVQEVETATADLLALSDCNCATFASWRGVMLTQLKATADNLRDTTDLVRN